MMPKTSHWSFVSLFFLIFLLSGRPVEDHKPQAYTSAFENVLGTSFDLKVWASNESQADIAERVALEEIDRLSGILSSYDPDSEFSKWSHTLNEDVRLSTELLEVLTYFDEWRARTDGAINPAAGVIINDWRNAEAAQVLPARETLDVSVKAASRKHWTIDMSRGTARHLTSTPLVMNSLVKSYILKKVADKLMGLPGISSLVVNIGGDLCIRGAEAEEIAIVSPDSDNADPLSLIRVKRRRLPPAEVTSGAILSMANGIRILWMQGQASLRGILPAQQW